MDFGGRVTAGTGGGKTSSSPASEVLQMQHFSAEGARLQNLCASQFVQLQQPRALVPGDRVVGLRRFDQVEQVAVPRIGGVMPARQRTLPDGCAVKVVEHNPNLVGLEEGAKLGVAARLADLIDLKLARQQKKPATLPALHDLRRLPVRRNQRAEIDVAVQQDQHHRLPIRARAQARDSSTAASISSGGTLALCSWTALRAVSKMCLLTASSTNRESSPFLPLPTLARSWRKS